MPEFKEEFYEKNEYIGYYKGLCVYEQADLIFIEVAPEKRGMGHGKRILDAFLEAAHKKGAEKVFLEVETTNIPAIRLYGSAGFIKTGTRKDYYGAGRDCHTYMLEFKKK